ncbi:MAG: dehydrogenase [Candidatus Hydrogenedentota bacterium]
MRTGARTDYYESTLTRRAFIASVATTAVMGCATRVNSAAVAPGKRSPNERLNVALIGCGGRGGENLAGVRSENIVALCDVDFERGGRTAAEFPNAKRYHDWRALLDDDALFDAVVVSTPDHMHAPISVCAMRLGKHVYCEKPLTRTIREARVMSATAKEYGVATQMGTQGVSFDGTRAGIELLHAGVIGAPREIHVWTDRAKNWWDQGILRPLDTPPAPKHLHWDLWLGAAPERPYHPCYHPFRWRGWKDFGSGAIGDMGIHNAALPFLGLRLGIPQRISFESSPLCEETFPEWAQICLEFPGRTGTPAVKLYWYDGGKKPPNSLIDGRELDSNGSIVVGDKGTLYSPDWSGDKQFLFPEEMFRDYPRPDPTLPRTTGQHEEWIAACKTGSATMCNFVDFAAPMTEIMQLGNLALLVGRNLEWDVASMKVEGCPEADAFISPEYRAGWHVEGLG